MITKPTTWTAARAQGMSFAEFSKAYDPYEALKAGDDPVAHQMNGPAGIRIPTPPPPPSYEDIVAGAPTFEGVPSPGVGVGAMALPALYI